MTEMRLAEARLAASTISNCSQIQLLIGAVWLCSKKASQPRIDSPKRTYVSPLAKSCAVVGTNSHPRCSATFSASSGCALPETRTRRFSPWLVMPVMKWVLLVRRTPAAVALTVHAPAWTGWDLVLGQMTKLQLPPPLQEYPHANAAPTPQYFVAAHSTHSTRQLARRDGRPRLPRCTRRPQSKEVQRTYWLHRCAHGNRSRSDAFAHRQSSRKLCRRQYWFLHQSAHRPHTTDAEPSFQHQFPSSLSQRMNRSCRVHSKLFPHAS